MCGSRDADVIVVGAGPAGCHAARRLGELGWSVLVLEKHLFPRWKPCAGAISCKADGLIPRALDAQTEATVHEAGIAFGAAEVRVSARRPVGRLVCREPFDAAHVALARATRGVRVEEGVAVRAVEQTIGSVVVRADGRSFRGRVAIGADGVESVVTRSLPGGDQRRFAVALEAEIEAPGLSPTLQFDFGAVAGGYGWVFPKRDHCSVGGYVLGGDGGGLRRQVAALVTSAPELDGRPERRRRGYRGPVGGTRRPLAAGRVLVTGDAADAVDPVSGEGIAFAFRSAEMAARAVDAHLRDGEPLELYTRRMWVAIHADLAVGRRVAELLYAHPRAAWRMLAGSRATAGAFVELFRGRAGYRWLLAGLLVRAPALPLATLRPKGVLPVP